MNTRIRLKTFLFLVIFSSLLSTNLYSQNLDIKILREINLNRNPKLDNSFKFLSNNTALVSISSPLLIYSAGLIKHNSDLKKNGLLVAESLVIASLISTSLKYSINRTRPFISYPDLEKLSAGGSPSFPSGHTTSAFSTATSLSIAFPKWYVIAPSFLWATSVGYSRMHLGVHYPSDVLVGAIIGTASAFFSYKLNSWIVK